MRAVVLLSGGIDSSTTLAVARYRGYDPCCLTILYGQKHSREIESAKSIARHLGASDHVIMELPVQLFSCSSLTMKGDIPQRMGPDEVPGEGAIPNTYVPGRNLVFLSLACSWAESIGAKAVFIGATSVDYSGYPDCRREFLESFERTAALATRIGTEGAPIRIEAPLLEMDKAAIIKLGYELGVDLSLTWSCYRGGKKACGRCDSCMYRLKGFKEASLNDPIHYEEMI
ncbi:MAG: 7-cyano-7-deazaguanine synthase QueC [Candidatus Thermoplasmatota archaeon]|nr:7-cyano-7-deazaguanine synthase QueC [Candidatus Thermoplasmatota archaeon]